MEGAFTSLPFGDAQATSGADYDAYHFAALDHDYESGTDHAQFRQYNNAQGRWLSPDPYRGSYDVSNPQSMNRYAYVVNNPLANIDPSGLVQADASWLNLQQLLAMSAGAQAYNLGYVLSNGGGINSPQGEFDLVNIPVTQYAYGDIPLNVPMGGGSCGQNCSYSMTLTSLGWGSVQVGTGLDFLMNWQPPTQLTPQTVAPTAPNKPAMPSTIVGYVKWAWNGGQGQSLQTRMLCTPIAAANVDGAYESIALTGVTVGAGLVGGLPGAGAAVGIGGGALALQSQLVKEANELTGCFQ
jgi:RHS repeat-associated protein